MISHAICKCRKNGVKKANAALPGMYNPPPSPQPALVPPVLSLGWSPPPGVYTHFRMAQTLRHFSL